MANQKKRLSKKFPQLLFASLVIAASLFSTIVLPSQTVQAASIKECFDKYDGKKVVTNSQTGNDEGFKNSGCVNYGCSPKDGIYRCTPEKSASAPLIELVCGENEPAYSDCYKEAKSASEMCMPSESDGTVSVDESRTGVKSYGKGSSMAAICFKEQYSGESPSNSKLKEAFDKATNNREEANQADREKRQEECEKDGKVFDDGKCVEGEGAAPTCNIDGIGWLVCPTMTFLAKMNDYAFNFISDKFLEVDSASMRDNEQMKSAWEAFRNIANVAFVIVFLIMIYSIMMGSTRKPK